MRIAIVHSMYSSRSPSGENIVVTQQSDELSAAGNDVALIVATTDDAEKIPFHSARAAWTTITGMGASPLQKLRQFEPDVVHVHNLFPNWGRSWLSSWDGPIVTTLHNFRPMCAAGTLYRDGQNCFDCPNHGSWNAVAHRCYRDSAVATIPLALATSGGTARNQLLTRANAIVVLSSRSHSIYKGAGLDETKLHIVPNFARVPALVRQPPQADHWMYAGRLSAEKGIVELVRAWPDDQNLEIFGEGPLREQLRKETVSRDNIRIYSSLPHSELPSKISAARGVVIPSRWAEGAVPMSYIEAIAVGTPVVALSGNAAADDITLSGSGLVYGSAGELHNSLRMLGNQRQRLSENASKRYVTAYSPKNWLTAMSSLYRNTIAAHSGPIASN